MNAQMVYCTACAREFNVTHYEGPRANASAFDCPLCGRRTE